MKRLQGLMIVVLCLVGSQSIALTQLGKHTMAVAQSMSAFYMMGLTDGDTRYETEFNDYADEAEQYLSATASSSLFTDLKNKWFRLRSQLRYDYMGGAGLTIPQSTRHDYRAYLTQAYQGWLAELQENSTQNKMEEMALKSEVISARYFDVSSTIYSKQDPAGLEKVNPTHDADLWLKQLNKVIATSKAPVKKKALTNVKTKWGMMQKALANYEKPGAYFLLYYNKKQMYKHLLGQS